MVDSPLIPDAGNQLTAPVQAQYSPAFLKADAAMAQTAGEKVPQSLRYQYWQAINGDKLAAGDPRAAAIAYDTAIMAGPQKAFELLKQTAADPAKMYQARNAYAQQMVAKDPQKYGPMEAAFKQHNETIGRSLGLIPAAQQGQTTSSAAPSATPVSNRDAMVNNIMRTIRGGESGGKYGIASFAEGKGSTASGGYQFADATWQEQARKLGGEATKYKRAKDAPREIPDAVAKHYVSDILRRNGDQPAEVFKEWYGGPKKYLTRDELAVNKGLTMDKYLASRMANYNKITGGQSGPETIASGQTPAQQPTAETPTDKPAAPEKSAFDKAADSVASGLADAANEKKPEAAPGIPITKPTVPLPTEPIAPGQRDMYAKALDAISKRNASTPPTQPSKPPSPEAPAQEPTPVKEAATPNDNEA